MSVSVNGLVCVVAYDSSCLVDRIRACDLNALSLSADDRNVCAFVVSVDNGDGQSNIFCETFVQADLPCPVVLSCRRPRLPGLPVVCIPLRDVQPEASSSRINVMPARAGVISTYCLPYDAQFSTLLGNNPDSVFWLSVAALSDVRFHHGLSDHRTVCVRLLALTIRQYHHIPHRTANPPRPAFPIMCIHAFGPGRCSRNVHYWFLSTYFYLLHSALQQIAPELPCALLAPCYFIHLHELQ